MMSQDHHPPGEGVEEGEDEEEGDMEARTAVAALLALTSPMDYSYTGYDDNYMIESTADEYMDNTMSPKYNEEDIDLDVTVEGSREEIPCAGEMDISESVEVMATNTENNLIPQAYSECVDGDDGLAQLRAFVQVTEGKNDEDDPRRSVGCEDVLDKSSDTDTSKVSDQQMISDNSRDINTTPVIDSRDNFGTLICENVTGMSNTSSGAENKVLKDPETKTVVERFEMTQPSETPDVKSITADVKFGVESSVTKVDVYRNNSSTSANGCRNSSADMSNSSLTAGVGVPTCNSLIPDGDFVSVKMNKEVVCKDLAASSGDDSDSNSDSDGDSDSDSSDSSSTDSDDDGSSSDSDPDSDVTDQGKLDDILKDKNNENKLNTGVKEAEENVSLIKKLDTCDNLRTAKGYVKNDCDRKKIDKKEPFNFESKSFTGKNDCDRKEMEKKESLNVESKSFSRKNDFGRQEIDKRDPFSVECKTFTSAVQLPAVLKSRMLANPDIEINCKNDCTKLPPAKALADAENDCSSWESDADSSALIGVVKHEKREASGLNDNKGGVDKSPIKQVRNITATYKPKVEKLVKTDGKESTSPEKKKKLNVCDTQPSTVLKSHSQIKSSVESTKKHSSHKESPEKEKKLKTNIKEKVDFRAENDKRIDAIHEGGPVKSEKRRESEKKFEQRRDGEKKLEQRRDSEKKFRQRGNSEEKLNQRRNSEKSFEQKRDSEKKFEQIRNNEKKFEERRDCEKQFELRSDSEEKFEQKRDSEKFQQRRDSEEKFELRRDGEKKFEQRRDSGEKVEKRFEQRRDSVEKVEERIIDKQIKLKPRRNSETRTSVLETSSHKHLNVEKLRDNERIEEKCSRKSKELELEEVCENKVEEPLPENIAKVVERRASLKRGNEIDGKMTASVSQRRDSEKGMKKKNGTNSDVSVKIDPSGEGARRSDDAKQEISLKITERRESMKNANDKNAYKSVMGDQREETMQIFDTISDISGKVEQKNECEHKLFETNSSISLTVSDRSENVKKVETKSDSPAKLNQRRNSSSKYDSNIACKLKDRRDSSNISDEIDSNIARKLKDRRESSNKSHGTDSAIALKLQDKGGNSNKGDETDPTIALKVKDGRDSMKSTVTTNSDLSGRLRENKDIDGFVKITPDSFECKYAVNSTDTLKISCDSQNKSVKHITLDTGPASSSEKGDLATKVSFKGDSSYKPEDVNSTKILLEANERRINPGNLENSKLKITELKKSLSPISEKDKCNVNNFNKENKHITKNDNGKILTTECKAKKLPVKRHRRVQKPSEVSKIMKKGIDKPSDVAYPQQVSLGVTNQNKTSPKKTLSPKGNTKATSTASTIKKNLGAAKKQKNPVSGRKVVSRIKMNESCQGDAVENNSKKDFLEEKGDNEIDDMLPLPIQAEVVMSEGSESGIEYGESDKMYPESDNQHLPNISGELVHLSDKENDELVAYLQSFVSGGGEGEIIEYPTSNNELPADGTDLTQWQLEGVRLPTFIPNVAPPSWLRLTIPAEGYRCHSCGDTFFIESSLVQHRERRSVWINLECGPCDAKLTFYNRCALKDHLRMHLIRGEEVDEETVEVRSLPLQLTRLLQPILVPVPQSLRGGKRLRITSKGHGSVTKLPTLKLVGRGGVRQPNERMVSGFAEDLEDEDCNLSDGMLSSPEKIPLGMKRLSPRRRTVRCYLCERMFHSVRELMAHMRTDQPYSDQRVECRKCQLVLPSVCAAKAHILTHPPANTSNVSVCPECGSRCNGPRDFVHHLNTCGHQFRRSGIVCTVCQVCFFKSQDDFLTHWTMEHCEKSYECVICQNTFESLVFHNCQAPGQQVLATFRCLLTCPLCSQTVQLHAQEESDANLKIQGHLAECHPSIITRVHYVYKSKFCTNAFRSKDELRAHHDREHRRDNHYRTKTCTLHHEVLGYQHQYFNGQEPRNAFVTLPVALSAEELHEARIRDVPTVSSVIDKTLFPDVPSLENNKTGKAEKQTRTKAFAKPSNIDADMRDISSGDSPLKKDTDQLDKLRPCVCYRCGFMYDDNKNFKRHKRTCDGEANERHCQVCGLTAIGEDFARHCISHIQEGVILCIYCNGTTFSSNADLEQHFELHVHEQFSYPANCAFCTVSLPDVPTALTHLNEEHDPFHTPFDTSEFECNRCCRRFHGERGLSVHLGRCTLGTATPTLSSGGCRQCQVCTKALTTEMFGRHMIGHLEEGLLVCSLCDGRTLPSSMALLHHLEEHAAALAYPSLCPMCNFAMLDSTSALMHLKEEHGFGNMLCTECDMHYNFTYQLQRHTDIVHKICLYAKRRYICWICRAYDHVKKETLMNHFRTVHGLDREQVDEKVMIRTRGQGTMPTSQFIPTKPLGSKEVPGLTSPNKGDVELNLGKSQKDKTKTPNKTNVTTDSAEQRQKESLQNSPVKLISNTHASPSGKKMNNRKKDDIKLKDKMKVLIKRLPDSVLDDHSRGKKRKSSPEEDRHSRKKPKKKKNKAFRCPSCGFGTNNKEKLDNHVLKHKDEPKEVEPDGFVCTECGASFVVEPSLARHMFFAHKVKIPVARVDESDVHLETEHTEGDSKYVGDSGNINIKLENDSKECESDISTRDNIVPVVGNVSIKEESLIVSVKQEPASPSKDLKEEGESNAIIDVKETVVKRKAVKTSAKKRPQKEVGKSPKDSVKAKIERDKMKKDTCKDKSEKPEKESPLRFKSEKAGDRQKTLKGTKKRRFVDISARKMASKQVLKHKVVKKNSKVKKVRDNKNKNQRILNKKKGDKFYETKWEGDSDSITDDHCVVCKEKFTNPVELYSHLRTHGMAFLKLGRKARPLGVDKTCHR
ncbi:hypothetical protein SK128_016001 [Halocaridina rubra]|uniref:C2H2-type domain-containing protein n=1 Tax=Halocaridina rubra TaxID=373956 RepID=A0AAN8X658_HALRR